MFLGDIIVPTISGLTKLIQLPWGCGEQNMITFVPNIFVIIYLKAINALTPDVLGEAKTNMLQGLSCIQFIL